MLKFVLAAALSLTVVSCGKSDEEKVKEAQKNMVAHQQNGNSLQLQGRLLNASAVSKLESKPINQFSADELKSLRAEFVEARKRFQSSNNSYDLVMSTAKKEEKERGATFYNPEVITREIRKNYIYMGEIDKNIKRIDERLSKLN